MRLLSSLRSRIFLTSAVLTVLSLGVAIYIVSVNVTTQTEGSLQNEITETGRLVEQLRTRSIETYTMMARLIADEPKADHDRAQEPGAPRHAECGIPARRRVCQGAAEGDGQRGRLGMDGQIPATTLPAGDRPLLSELLRRSERLPNVTLGDEE